MKIRLTGSSGYIGKKLHAALNAKYDYEVLPFDEYGDKQKWLDRFHNEWRDSCDLVIHAGAIMDPQYTHEDIHWWNTYTTFQIVNYCKDAGAKLLFFSTCQAIQPVSQYGWSKWSASQIAQAKLDDSCIVRPFVVYGDEYGRSSKLSAVGKLIRGELPVVFEPWERDWIHVRDVVRAIVHIIDHDIKGLYDLGTGRGIEARELFGRWGEPMPPTAGPGHPNYPDREPPSLVAQQLIPGFTTNYHVLEYLEEMKQYGNRVY